ncbi:uncharacterized protein EV422DRAFT_77936 [Fimicolochytrium jonesii]|uniref:uncharacterized protein n=1 Tax=Fimicolochytrium jonesii TaxID=1396493 RepID=UPI0022FEC069|nr:uncharacterized protein EV422DRAFT_77936 [Fimicolochytrium jonesii]KAI8820085.1 hypothetical protein EV422DRAFT_77936 [Fimicolochytrium jonesii]
MSGPLNRAGRPPEPPAPETTRRSLYEYGDRADYDDLNAMRAHYRERFLHNLSSLPDLRRRPAFVDQCRQALRDLAAGRPLAKRRRGTGEGGDMEEFYLPRRSSSLVSMRTARTQPEMIHYGNAPPIFLQSGPEFSPQRSTSPRPSVSSQNMVPKRSASLAARSFRSFSAGTSIDSPRRRPTLKSLMGGGGDGDVSVTASDRKVEVVQPPRGLEAIPAAGAIGSVEAHGTLEDQLRDLAAQQQHMFQLQQEQSRRSSVSSKHSVHLQQPVANIVLLKTLVPPTTYPSGQMLLTNSLDLHSLDTSLDNDSRVFNTIDEPIVPTAVRLPSMLASSRRPSEPRSVVEYPALRWVPDQVPNQGISLTERSKTVGAVPNPQRPYDAAIIVKSSKKKAPPVTKAFQKLRRSISTLALRLKSKPSFSDDGHMPPPVPRVPIAHPGPRSRSKIYESRTSVVIKDVSPETVAEALAPGSSYAQVLASLKDSQLALAESSSGASSSPRSGSTIYIRSEDSDPYAREDERNGDGHTMLGAAHQHEDEERDLIRELDSLSMRTAIRVDNIPLRKSFSEPHLRTYDDDDLDDETETETARDDTDTTESEDEDRDDVDADVWAAQTGVSRPALYANYHLARSHHQVGNRYCIYNPVEADWRAEHSSNVVTSAAAAPASTLTSSSRRSSVSSTASRKFKTLWKRVHGFVPAPGSLPAQLHYGHGHGHDARYGEGRRRDEGVR